ncbi:MAG: hypothetical protein OXP75_16990 [Rhodospirillales bacterium]|nr:hypothetical protein [Rhodospirillales bacterium]
MADRSRIGIVTGLVAEAATLPENEFRIAVSAADPARAAQAADAMVAGGARLLVSYGLAAGIDPRLGPGALLLPEAVIAHEGEVEAPDRGGVRDQLQRMTSFRREEGRGPPEPPPDENYLPVDATVREALSQGLGERAEAGALAGVDHPLMYGDQKLSLFAQTRARAADMESHVVARVAAAAGVPFVVIRVVSDPSNRALPRAAIVGVTEDGRISGGAVAGALLRRPWECMDMLTLALDGAQAMRRLRRVGRRLAPLLADL